MYLNATSFNLATVQRRKFHVKYHIINIIEINAAWQKQWDIFYGMN